MQDIEKQSTTKIKRSMAVGAALMVLSKTMNRCLGLISTMILARILIPDDYGIIAMAMSFYALIEIMGAMGIDISLIQKDSLIKADYNSAWSIRLCFYFVLSSTLLSIAPLISDFYNEPRLIDVVRVLSISMFLTGLENIKIIDFRRNLQFKKEFWFQFGVKISGFLTTVPLALWLQNYWALVAGMVISRVCSLVLSYVLIPYKPAICFSETKHIFNFSKWLLPTNLLKFLDRKLPHLILGKLLGTKPLGVYSLSSELANYPSTELCAPINRALFPGYARLKNKQGELQKTYLDILGILTLIVLPIGVGVSATSQYIIPIILGEHWDDAIIPLSILATAFAVTALSSNAGYIYLAVGKPKIGFFASLLKVIILIPLLLLLTSQKGIVGAAISYLIIAAIMPMIHYIMISKLLCMKIWKIFSVQYRPVISSMVMYMVLKFDICQSFLDAQSNVLISMIMAVVIGVVTYTFLIAIFWAFGKCADDTPEKRLVLLVRSALKKENTQEFSNK